MDAECNEKFLSWECKTNMYQNSHRNDQISKQTINFLFFSEIIHISRGKFSQSDRVLTGISKTSFTFMINNSTSL